MSKNKNIVILGAGESGTGAAILAQAKGFDVFVSDKGEIKEKYKTILQEKNILFEEKIHTEEKILNATEIIKSPGIPNKADIIKKAKEKNINIISEIEFAARYTHAKKICITGSNGKTTTTMLTHHILSKAGYNVGLAGNVGKSFAWQVAEENFDYYVIELSSFQLDDMHHFKAEIAILLNITPDHLDRYEYQFENYALSKFRITNNQTPDNAFIYCIDDEGIMKYIDKVNPQATRYPFSIKQNVEGDGAYLTDETLINININQNPITMTIEQLALQGKHNVYNSMASAIAARIADVRKETIRESLSDFVNIEHRLETVATINGIEFINDSKATNINSVWYALESMNKPVVLIMGGVDKGNDYTQLYDLVKEKVKALVCLGVDNSKLKENFSSAVETLIEAQSMNEAVAYAYKLGKKGDVVLLSPACASFDLFQNYEDRGMQFKSCVRAL
ncbi:MAG: UDP-N-acetylmuramoyl-L-alanine--D-glutamate ligase [Bacteroidetes bacterium]|nr:UDP-N-acetylmuramoyl-L-alanine--D-glutamate ligase [Bacteroidota bacterium]